MRSWLKKDETKTMSQLDQAYLAGFFDGEGCVGVYGKGGRSGKYRNWVLTISNTHRPTLKYCQKLTGVGSVVEKKTKLLHHKKQWVWNVKSQRNIVSILTQMLPFLKIKKKKVKILLASWRDV